MKNIKNENVKSIIIVGVGGQGTLLASRILGYAVMKQGYDVKVSEVHGMSQRGGSVITYVRYGERVHSPVIDAGEADLILAFEQLETARYLPFLKTGGGIVTNTQMIDPMPVITGAMPYPSDLLEAIEARNVKVKAVHALSLAKQAGTVRAVNVVLIGAMARQTDIPREVWLDALESCVPQRFIEINKAAFELGFKQ